MPQIDDAAEGIDPTARAALLRTQLGLRKALDPHPPGADGMDAHALNHGVRLRLIEAYERLSSVDDPIRWFYQRLEVISAYLIPWAADAPFEVELLYGYLTLDIDVVRLADALHQVRPETLLGPRATQSVKAELDEAFRAAIGARIAQNLQASDRQSDAAGARLGRYWEGLEHEYDDVTSRDPAANGDIVESRIGDVRARLESLIQDTEKSRDAAQRAAGLSADFAMSGVFARSAIADERAATFLSLASVSFLGAAAVAGLVLLTGLEEYTWQLFVAKLAVGIPLVAISAYLGRLASHYRSAARWEKTAQVQLATIDGFVRGFWSPEHGDEIRLELGRRVYGGHGDVEVSPATTIEMSDVTALVQAIGDISKRGI